MKFRIPVMKTVYELYPEHAKEEKEGGYFYGPGDYNPMLHEFGNVLLQVDDEDYQGDSRLLYGKDGKIGYLQFGWGSCSGCDALQACNNMKDIEELMNDLFNQIKWFDSKDEALKYFNEHDWEGDYSWHEDEQKRFVEGARKILST